MQEKFITSYQVNFDLDRINEDLILLLEVPSVFDIFLKHNQISFKNQELYKNDFTNGIGSLWDETLMKFKACTSEFSYLHHSTPSYFVQIYNTVKELADTMNLGIGRMRLMKQRPKTCLSFHVDPDLIRFHIPIETNLNCGFIGSENKTIESAVIESMPNKGLLYSINTKIKHSAVNMDSGRDRIHLVMDTYQK